MPHPATIQKVLIIGSGPIRIGQTGAFDDAACQACNVFREAGLGTIMVHCDPSALAADVGMADRTYMVPLSINALTDILVKEKPDALLPTVGGPKALQMAKALADSGFLEECAIRLLGVSAASLALIDDPGAFSEMATTLGLSVPEGRNSLRIADAAAQAEGIGYPVFVRAAEPGGTLRHGIAFNVEELRQIAAGGRLPSDTAGRFRVEQALSGCIEVEVAVMRDSANNIRIAAMAENLDPVGIHSGDSTAVTPLQTVDASIRGRIEKAAAALAEKAAVNGIVNFKFAIQPKTGDLLPLAMDIGYGRTTAFMAKAFDHPLAEFHARLSLGMDLKTVGAGTRLDSAKNENIVAVRLPHWEFERFPGEDLRLDARMKSTGATMGLGHRFIEAFLKALRAAEPRRPLPALSMPSERGGPEVYLQRLVVPSPDRMAVMHAALMEGASPEDVAAVTGIALPWIHQLADLVDLESALLSAARRPLPPALGDRAVKAGFNASVLAHLLTITEDEAETMLSAAAVHSAACPASDTGAAHVWFHTAGNDSALHQPLGKSVVIVAPGTDRIGQSIELYHCCAHAARALHAAGRKVVMAGANPGMAAGSDNIDRTYADPLTTADVNAICQAEEPEGVILQFGGYRAMDMAEALNSSGFPVLGTPHGAIRLCQDRLRFSRLLTDLGIPHPQLGVAETPDGAMDQAETLGYPLLAGAASDHQGRRRTIIMDARMLEQYVMDSGVSSEAPILLEQFIEYAIEVEADALCDGQSVYVPAVMEHIELAGVHSGDSAMVVPPYSTPPRHVETIGTIVDKIALELGIRGVLNTRFAVLNDTVYLLEVRPWACRTLPMISKICNVPMAQRAVEIMLGMTLDEMNLQRCLLPHYAIRSSVFPFDTFTEADPLLGPRMCSTGQVMVMAAGFGMSYFTSQEAAGPSLPLDGKVLITVTDTDKPSILEPARLFKEMGFGIQATRGTHAFLKKNGIDAQLVKKLGFGRPDLVDAIKTGEVVLVINTPSGRQSQQDDAYIRKTAIRYRIPNITTPAGALAAAKGIAARKRGQDALCTLQSYVRALR